MTRWEQSLRPTPECIAIDRLDQELTASEREHVASCPRCQAELALLSEFTTGETASDEKEPVDWIVAELHRRGGHSSNVVPIPLLRRILVTAATLMIVVSAAYYVRTREPSIDVPLSRSAYRSASVSVVGPVGDLNSVPTQLQWSPFGDADAYDVEITEVDRTILWRATTADTHIELPVAVIAQFVPAKTILWNITARRGSTVLARSGTERFRVRRE